MKHFLIALALLCSFPSFADEEPTIKDSMRVIGRNFGMLSRALFQFKEVNESKVLIGSARSMGLPFAALGDPGLKTLIGCPIFS